jgi:hypothetical protein
MSAGQVGLAPGLWTPTGWGRQHRVRAVTQNDSVVELVCHMPPHGYVFVDRLNTAADEPDRCRLCTVIDGLGPMWTPLLGQVRRSPDGLAMAVCGETWDDRTPTSPTDEVWCIYAGCSRVVGPDAGRVVDSYTVVDWPVVTHLPVPS